MRHTIVAKHKEANNPPPRQNHSTALSRSSWGIPVGNNRSGRLSTSANGYPMRFSKKNAIRPHWVPPSPQTPQSPRYSVQTEKTEQPKAANGIVVTSAQRKNIRRGRRIIIITSDPFKIHEPEVLICIRTTERKRPLRKLMRRLLDLRFVITKWQTCCH